MFIHTVKSLFFILGITIILIVDTIAFVAGPAGAGFLTLVQDTPEHVESLSLGVATNNVAELEALGLAFRHAIDVCEQSQVVCQPRHFFVDNSYAINVVLGSGSLNPTAN